MGTTGTRAHRRGDDGAGTLEWAGALLVVAAAVGVLAWSGVPDVVAAHTASAICRVAGGAECATPDLGERTAAQSRRPEAEPEPAGGRRSARSGAKGDDGAPRRAGRPSPPQEETAREKLAELTVAPEGDEDGYDREKFPHWSQQDDGCDTREAVLKRDGDGVRTASDCYPTSGRWFSPYDGETWDHPADVDIDHLVPLAEAWRSGADEWTDAQREAFANDLDRPQLWAVTDNVNQSKGDRDPADWRPPNEEVHCEYARAWIDVKHHWKLTVDKAEKAALAEMLDTC